MKNLILAMALLFLGEMSWSAESFCIEKSEVQTVVFYFGNLLKVTTSGPEYILMTQGCGELSDVAYFDLKSAVQDSSSICIMDTVVLQNSQKEAFGSCLITEVLKEEP